MTVLSLAMGITVFVTLQNYLSHLSVAGAVSEHLGDYPWLICMTDFAGRACAHGGRRQCIGGGSAAVFFL